jgi:antitoxin component of MazEF toxin-antitoxin module
VSVEGKSIVIKPAPRQGWADTFKQYAMSGEEKSFFPDVFNDEDLGDIQWEKK